MKRIVFICMLLNGILIEIASAQVAPLLTTTWNQGCNYNANCPVVSGGPCGRAYTGCNATAMAQLLKYYSYPAAAWGGAYTNVGTPVQTVDYSSASYNWSIMPNTLSGANSEVAKIMYHAGVALDMQYGGTVSNSFFKGDDVLKRFYKYSLSTKGVAKLNYTNSEWEILFKNELDNGRVVYVKGGAHIYLVDGYQLSPSLKFHCNFGWGGLYDGYYNLHGVVVGSTDYSPSNAIIGTKPLIDIEASIDTIIVSSSSGVANYELSSLNNWTVSSSQIWCTPSVVSGIAGYYDYNDGATANITANTTYTARFASITATDGINSRIVTIKQNGIQPFLIVSQNNLTYSSAGGSQNLNISVDSNWVASTSATWLSITPNNGTSSGSITITASSNGLSSRTGNVIITRGNLQQNISVFQAASGSFWCTPAMTISGSNGITNVTLNTINRTSANNETYINTGVGTTLKLDSTYILNVTFTGGNAPAIWIDWNIDGDFNDAGEAVMPGAGTWYPSFASTKTLNITVPSSAVEGSTRMRVYAKSFGTGPVSGPCNTTDVGGDIEDYDIAIMNHKHINVSPVSLSYINSGGTQNINVDSDSAWTATTSASWLILSPNNGSGVGVVSVTSAANTSLVSQNSFITFTRGNKTKTVAVNQSPADTILSVSTAAISATNTGGINSFYVISNASYFITSNQSWISTDVSSGNGNLMVNINVSNNPTNLNRIGIITVYSGTHTHLITVTQDSTSAILSVSPSTLVYAEFGGSQPLSIVTSSSWIASTSSSWIILSQNSGTGNSFINITCDTNLFVARTGTVTISNGIVTQMITINQENHKYISVSSTSLNYPNTGSLQNINIDSDSTWIASTNASWLVILPNTGTGMGTVGVTASANTTLNSRNDTVVFVRGNISKTLIVSQDPSDTILAVSPTNMVVVNTGGINSFNVVSNASYTITSNQTWIVPDVTSGTGDITVNLNISNNPTNLIRTGIVTVASGTYINLLSVIQDSISTSVSIINHTEHLADWVVYPNPSNCIFYIKAQANIISENKGYVYNALGELVLMFEIKNNEPVKIDLSNFANGIFFCNLMNSEKEVKCIKLIKG